MTPEWLEDGRKVPDDVMYYIRRMAVYAVRVLGQSPEKVAEAYNFDRSCIYRWLKQYDEGGFESLESHMPRGTDPIITKATDDWMKQAVLNSTRIQPGRTGLERGQEQPHRKAAGEKQAGFEGPPYFRIGFVETNQLAYYFFFPSAGHQVCGGCRLISFGLYIIRMPGYSDCRIRVLI